MFCPQGLKLHIDVSTPQRPKLHLNVSGLQGYVLLLRLSISNHEERTIEIGIDPSLGKVMRARLWDLPISNVNDTKTEVQTFRYRS